MTAVETTPVLDRSLATTLERVSALDPYLAGGIGRDPALDPGGWVTPGELCDVGDGTLDSLLADVGRQWGTAERRVQASFLIGGYAWYAVAPVLAAYLLERRVPSLAQDNVAVWLDPADGPGRLALGSDRFTAVATDPAAGTRSVTVVPDEDTLRDALHDEIVGHMTPLIAAFRARTPLGMRAQWLEVADRVGSALHHAGERSGTEAAAIREADALVHRPGSPLNSPRSRFAMYEHLGERRVVKLRGACCLSYRIDGHAYCMSCPLVDEAERAERVRAWIAEEPAEIRPEGDR